MTETKHSKELEKAYNAYQSFIKLCKLLFSRKDVKDDEPPKLINELIDKDSEFYPDATSIAKECGMAWESLLAEDSDEIELMLLEDYYNRINVNGRFNYIIKISVQEMSDKEV